MYLSWAIVPERLFIAWSFKQIVAQKLTICSSKIDIMVTSGIELCAIAGQWTHPTCMSLNHKRDTKEYEDIMRSKENPHRRTTSLFNIRNRYIAYIDGPNYEKVEVIR